MAANQSLKFLIDANSDQAVAQIKRAVEAVFGLGNATLTVNKDSAEAYRKVQASTSALAGATAAAADRVRTAYQAQRAALDPLYASTQRYASVVQTVSAALEAQVIDQTEANSVLAMAAQRYQAVDKAAAVAGTQARQMGGSTNAMAFQVQNAAFQIGDFAVQVAGGTSAVRALTQQLPQLLGGFGLWGAVIGGAVAVAGALAPMMFSMGEGANAAKDRIDALNSTLSDFNQNATIGATSVAELRKQYGQWADEVQATAQWMAQVNVGQAAAALKAVATDQLATMDGVNQGLLQLSIAQRQYDQSIANGIAASSPAMQQLAADIAYLKAETDAAAQAIGLTSSQVLTLDSAFSGMQGAKTMADIQARSKEALDAIEAMFPAGQSVPPEIAKIAAQFQDVYTKASQGLATMQDMPGAIGSATSAAGGLASAMGRVGMAANAALSQMIQMDVTRRAMQSAAQRQAAAPGGIGPAGMGDGSTAYVSQSARAQAEAEAAKARILAAPAPVFRASSGSGGGGGGGGGSNPVTDLQRSGTDALRAMEIAMAGVNEKVKLGLMTTAEGTKAIADAKDKAANALADLIPQLEQIGGPAAKGFVENWRNAIKDMADGLSETGQQLSASLSGSFENAFASFIAGTSSGKDAFQSFTQSVLADLAKVAAQRFAMKFVTPMFDSLLGGLGFAKGGVPALGMGGTAMAFAKGGIPAPLSTFRNTIAERPTFFAMGGMQRGVMGEAGAEAIMPLTRGRDGKLGVASQGGGASIINIHNYGAQVTATESRNSNGVSVTDIVIKQIKGAIVDDISRGGDVSDALARSFGANRRGQ